MRSDFTQLLFSADETADIGSEAAWPPVSDDYGPADNAFNGSGSGCRSSSARTPRTPTT